MKMKAFAGNLDKNSGTNPQKRSTLALFQLVSKI